MLYPPGAEACHDGLHEVLADILIPEVRMHGHQPKEPYTPPARGEVRANQLAVEFRTKGCCRIGTSAGVGIVHIRPKLLGLWRSQECPKGEADDATSFRKILGGQRADDECRDATSYA
jgi:hypothetical protein